VNIRNRRRHRPWNSSSRPAGRPIGDGHPDVARGLAETAGKVVAVNSPSVISRAARFTISRSFRSRFVVMVEVTVAFVFVVEYIFSEVVGESVGATLAGYNCCRRARCLVRVRDLYATIDGLPLGGW